MAKGESFFIFAVILLITFSSAGFAGTYSGGTGEPNDPYLIATAEDLNDIGNHPEDFNKCFLMVADINLADYTGTQFNIIGDDVNAFTGVFDGNGYSIANFTYNTGWDTIYENIALFGFAGNNSIVRNVTLTDVDVFVRGEYCGVLVGINLGDVEKCEVVGGQLIGNTGKRIGGLIGCNSGHVSNCYTELFVSLGKIHSYSDPHGLGGLVGWSNGSIENCWATADVEAEAGVSKVGGLIGEIDGGTVVDSYTIGMVKGGCDEVGGLAGSNETAVIRNCYSDVIISATGLTRGGLVGRNSGTIEKSHATGDISTADSAFTGGLAGTNGSILVHGPKIGIIKNSYAVGNVSGGNLVGGLAGNNCYGSLIAYSYSLGDVTGTGEATGGLVGESYMARISDCYSKSNVSGNYKVGGLAGSVNGSYQYTDENYFRRCYSTGNVGGDSLVGGLVGYRYWTTVSNSFWDVNSSGMDTSAAGTGKTTTQVQKESTFTDAGWDFIDIWDIGEDQTYPFLRTHPAADIDHDNIVNFYDFAILADHWLQSID